MKIRFTLLALLALLSFSIVACEEDPASPDDPTMKAEIDGDTKETESVTVNELASSRIITGAFTDGTSINITLSGVTAPKTISLPDGGGSGIAYSSGGKGFIAKSGEIDVTTYDENGVAGTFSFVGLDVISGDTVEVTDGTFSGAVN